MQNVSELNETERLSTMLHFCYSILFRLLENTNKFIFKLKKNVEILNIDGIYLLDFVYIYIMFLIVFSRVGSGFSYIWLLFTSK